MFNVLKSRSILLLIVFAVCCRPSTQNQENDVLSIRQAEDAKGINPIFVRDAFSNYLCLQIFQPLTAIDYKTEEKVGVIAKTTPTIKRLEENKKKLTFQLRENVSFDSVSAVRSKDVIFSVKLHLLRAPGSTTAMFFSFIDSVAVNAKDSMQIQFFVEDQINVADYCGSIQIMPQHIYDPNKVLEHFSIEQLKEGKTYEQHKALSDYVAFIKQQQFSQNPKFIKGSGSYALKKWKKEQYILLQRKQDWYGTQYSKENNYFVAASKSIKYKIINDEQAAIISLKSADVDLLSNISGKSFHQLKEEQNENIKLNSSPKLGYHCLGFNLKNEFLSNIELRKALAHSIDSKQILQKVFYGLGKTTLGPLSPYREEYYNKNLRPYGFDLVQAKAILKAEKIVDSNNDGWREMQVNGQPKKIELVYTYNAGNKERERTGIILKENAEKIGIDIRVRPLEWNVYLQQLKSGALEIFYTAVSSGLLAPNFEGSFHSSSINNGRNYFNLNNPKIDSLIDALNNTEDKEEHIKLAKAFQKEIHNNVIGIFLFSGRQTFAVSSAVKGFYTSKQRPHYWAPNLYKEN